MTQRWNALLDAPEFPPHLYAPLADRIARLLGTASDIVFVQAEAVLALEAVATSISRPGLVALNLVTSAYGVAVAEWLRKGGAETHDLHAEPGQPITEAAVASALDALPQVDIVAWTHGESSTGVVNPLESIAELAHAKGALTVVDAVASAAAHTLDLKNIDVAVIGPQKALAGPAGVSIVACSSRAWAHMAACSTPGPSLLSLTGIKRDWIDRGRGALPGTPPALEFWALDAAIARAEIEGLGQIILRHRLAAMATRSGLRALGIAPWVNDDACASHLATTLAVPDGLEADALVASAPQYGARLNHAGAPMRGRLVRLDHMGRSASAKSVISNLAGFGRMLCHHGYEADSSAAAEKAAAIYITAGKDVLF
jgi:aspartate aminotransferase-like enzyme